MGYPGEDESKFAFNMGGGSQILERFMTDGSGTGSFIHYLALPVSVKRMALRKMDSNSLVSFSSFPPRAVFTSSIGPQGGGA